MIDRVVGKVDPSATARASAEQAITALASAIGNAPPAQRMPRPHRGSR